MKANKETEFKQKRNSRTSILWQPLHNGDAIQYQGKLKRINAQIKNFAGIFAAIGLIVPAAFAQEVSPRDLDHETRPNLSPILRQRPSDDNDETGYTCTGNHCKCNYDPGSGADGVGSDCRDMFTHMTVEDCYPAGGTYLNCEVGEK